ncbi:MAG: SCP2 sterol-binding domain-containing protein [Lachnospiraceae bacterium]|nr:SCP2 sterol-binding domain-containing protein [Lachnospiraceae bacterium]
MKVNIYYGGRGLIDDPTQYVLKKMTEVLEELRATVTRYNIFEQKSGIAMLANTLKDADAVILAVSVEWFGIGGMMQQFLDSCWLYADKNKLKRLFMFPVVVSTTAGEHEALFTLVKAWETLGGFTAPGITAYVENNVDFENNEAYKKLIEKKAEDVYRTISQKMAVFPSSYNPDANAGHTAATSIELTPQESEQLSIYVSDDTFVEQQKKDVEELSQLYKGFLAQDEEADRYEFIKEFKNAFIAPEDDFNATYLIRMTDTSRALVIEISGKTLNCKYGTAEKPDVTATTNRETINTITKGRATFQGAFMSSKITCKGDFKLLRKFDQMFRFE